MDASHHNHSLQICRSNSMLSTTQAGFCTQKDPIHQLKNVVMALEDAKLFHKDIYALIVDFTSAFNTTDPDRMLWIMYDLDFPTDAIDAVKNFYENATTQVKLPSGVCTGQIWYTSRERHELGRHPLPIPFPSLYKTPPAMAACRRTRLRPHLHPQRKQASDTSGQQHQQRLLRRRPPLPHGYPEKP